MSAKQILRSFGLLNMAVFLMTLPRCDVQAKAWRGIVPLKSTRADVERQLGKANEYDSYQIENERATVFYYDGNCEDSTKCECLVPKGTVLRVSVAFDSPVKLSTLNIDKKQYTYRKAPSGEQSTYSDVNAGVVYAVDERRQIVVGVDYWPSNADCREILKRALHDDSWNVWRGLTPLRSSRADVERLLGVPKDSVGKTLIYETPTETVHVPYSEGACKQSAVGQWNVPAATVLQIRVYPRTTILLRDLHLDLSKYQRRADPNIPNWAFYSNNQKGMIIQTKLEDGCEQVMIITFEPTKNDIQLHCRGGTKSADKKL